MVLRLALIAFCAIFASAFTLPADLKDGSYRVTLNENGQEIHERSTGPAEGDWTTAATLEARESAFETRELLARQAGPEIKCGCGFYLNHGECDAATADLRNQLGNDVSIKFGQAYYSIRGGTVVFACNYGQNGFGHVPAQVDTTFFNVALGVIDANCGRYVAGTYLYFAAGYNHYRKRANQVPWMGHQQYTPGADFCHTSVASSVNHC